MFRVRRRSPAGATKGPSGRVSPDGLFFGDAGPRIAFAIVRGSTELPMEELIALDRGDSLADALAPKAAAAK